MRVSFDHVRFAHPRGTLALAVDGLAIGPGEAVALVGPSGCGKTTILDLAAGLLLPLSGTVAWDGVSTASRSPAGLRRVRLASFGVVFHDLELLEYLTVAENLLLPHRLLGRRPDPEERAESLGRATRLGLAPLLARDPGRLSQGERQRVAACRALATQPPFLLADEPTGRLDPDLAARVLDLLLEHVRSRPAALLAATHDVGLLERFDRVVDVRSFHAVAAAGEVA